MEGVRKNGIQGLLIMSRIMEKNGGVYFQGNVANTDDLRVASTIAETCPAYSIDEDDEDYCNGVRTCFNCRYRRWLADGFSCARELLC